MSALVIIIITSIILNISFAWNIGPINEKLFSKRTVPLIDTFSRLKYHETIKIQHNQFHSIDDSLNPYYPMNGKIEFHAFGNYYKLWIRKNVELFSDNFHYAEHTRNNITNEFEFKHHSFDIHQCHYTAKLGNIFILDTTTHDNKS